MSKFGAARARRDFFYIFSMLVFWVVFKFLDPLGLESATKQSSAAFFSAITTPYYGLSSSQTHRNVAVVEINDETVKAFDQSFPFTYRRHIATLNTILDAHPSAIFVDLRMMTERTGESFGSFRPLIDRARSLGVPLLFARGDTGPHQQPLPEPLTGSQIYSEGVTQEGTYPLLPEEEGGEKTEEKPQKMSVANPALDIYLSLCKAHKLASCGPVKIENFRQPMIIRWGIQPDPDQKLVSSFASYWQNQCRGRQGAECSRFGMASSLGIRYAVGHHKPGQDRFVYYPLTIGAEQLDDRGLGTPEGSPPLKALLAGRAVFYGTDLRDQHDDTLVPMLNRVPGVVVHAMAFDNLVTYGKNYFREPPEMMSIWGWELDRAEFGEAVVWLIFTVGVVVRRRRVPADQIRLFPKLLAYDRLAPPVRLAGGVIGIIILCALVLTADLYQRGSVAFLAALAPAYGLWAALLCLSWFLLHTRSYEQARSEGEEASFAIQIVLVTTFASIGFMLNEMVLRWPDADWIGFVLLWLATFEAREETGFVSRVSDWLECGWDWIIRHIFRRHQERKS